MDGLTNRQEAFVREYLVDFNATQAAIRAGYSDKGATVRGSELLANRKVQAALAEAIGEQAKRTEVTADRVVEELARVGFASLRDIASWDEHGVTFKASHELTDEQAASVRKVESVHTTTDEGHERITRKAEQHDKLRALELLGKRFGIFTDKLQVGGDGDNPIEIEWGT